LSLFVATKDDDTAATAATAATTAATADDGVDTVFLIEIEIDRGGGVVVFITAANDD